ncbi:MAG: hypothetical protein MUF49_00660 [Oculatellaceae cyanobacterium Prado106]|jgi:hypothetical protein|nr:hypothetical protein [Oculatellaceae cyanobacterium Prado106]
MSEYQHYEFQAIDRPLTRAEQSYVRSLSSRVELTPTKAVFVYNYGDFPVQPKQVVEKCFDAMLYQASFGVQQLILRFPRSLINPAVFAAYQVPEFLTVSFTEEFVLLDIDICEEEGMGWIRDEDWLTKLVPLREELLRGDFRLLYLAWLIAAQIELAGEDETILEPPVPANLSNLSAGLEAFVDLFGLDQDLIEAAAEASPLLDETEEPLDEWVAALPEAERNEFLVRIARGEPHVAGQLLKRLREEFQPQPILQFPPQPQRSLAQLLNIAADKEKYRKTREQQVSRQIRIAQLESLASKEAIMWQEVSRLIELKQTKAYEQAIEYLIDLRDLAEHQGRLAQFIEQIKQIQRDYQNYPSFLTLLNQSGIFRG